MKMTIVPAGNSSGVMKPPKKESRKDWEDYFKQMKKLKDDNLLIFDKVDLDMKEWEW
jgi:replicative DNA helicase